MRWFAATMEADATTPWHILNNRQKPLKFWWLGDGNMVAEGRDLISDTLKGVAEPSTIDNKATGDSIAMGLIAIKMDVHKV